MIKKKRNRQEKNTRRNGNNMKNGSRAFEVSVLEFYLNRSNLPDIAQSKTKRVRFIRIKWINSFYSYL